MRDSFVGLTGRQENVKKTFLLYHSSLESFDNLALFRGRLEGSSFIVLAKFFGAEERAKSWFTTSMLPLAVVAPSSRFGIALSSPSSSGSASLSAESARSEDELDEDFRALFADANGTSTFSDLSSEESA
jgi:hypothetical protein